MRLVVFILLFLAACKSNNLNSDSSQNEMSGEVIFNKYCVNCHGIDGKLGLNGAKDLSLSILANEEKTDIITHGKGAMTPFGKILSPAEIENVTIFVNQLTKPERAVIDTFNR